MNWPEIYIASWGALFGALIVGFYPSSKKTNQLFEEYANSIRSQNAKMGLDWSVSETELALDYLLPRRSDRIERYSQNNGIEKDDYVATLDEEVGKPTQLITFIGLLALALLVGFLGPVIYLSTELTYIGEYLVVFLFMLLVNLVAYSLL